jgi:hypothetical protein
LDIRTAKRAHGFAVLLLFRKQKGRVIKENEMKIARKRPPLAVITATMVLLLWWPKLQAQDDPYYKKQVRGYLSKSTEITYLVNHGFKYLTDGEREGYIYLKGSQEATWRVEAGYSYAFTGVCDDDCGDMDFALYDPDGRKVAEDTEPDDHPAVVVPFAKQGSYTVRATIPKCNAPVGCYWAVQALWK